MRLVPCEQGSMGYEMDAAGQSRLVQYMSGVGDALGNKKRRESFAAYVLGLLSNIDRKSAEPIAALATSDPALCDMWHQRLLHFLADSPWSDQAVRRVAAQHAIEAMQAHEPVRTWIIDDTGFIKQGSHSVGVQRQYTGSAGKITNCQIAVSLSVATRSAHVPIDFALYLPESWTSDPARRAECKIPVDVLFKTKHDLALDLIVSAVDDKVPGDILLADSAYGDSYEFREAVRVLGFDYAVGIHATTRLWRLDGQERRRGEPLTARAIADMLPLRVFRTITWRDGTMPGKRSKLRSRFHFCRVKVAHDDGTDAACREPVWLIVEWPEGETAPSKFALTTLRRTMSKKQIVRTLKERYRTERVYEEMKGQLGLDHFEGRSFPGWHHHVSVALCCYAFVIGERMRHFPPEAERPSVARPIWLAA
jgi:SRSO17 transposase